MSGDAEDMNMNSEVQLTRIEGKIDVMNERHDRVVSDVQDLKQRVQGHSNRIGLLETKENMRAGERKGAETTIRAIWAVVAAVGVGGVALVLRMLGV